MDDLRVVRFMGRENARPSILESPRDFRGDLLIRNHDPTAPQRGGLKENPDNRQRHEQDRSSGGRKSDYVLNQVRADEGR